jgi:hypothetical protein
MEEPRKDFTNRKLSPVTVEDPATGQKRKYSRVVDAEKDIGGKRLTFGKKRGNTIPTMNVMWLGIQRKKLLIKEE